MDSEKPGTGAGGRLGVRTDDKSAAAGACAGLVRMQRTHVGHTSSSRDVQVLTGRWYLGAIVCDFFISLDVCFCTSSILNLTAISFDRCALITIVPLDGQLQLFEYFYSKNIKLTKFK